MLQSADYGGLVVDTGMHETYQSPRTVSSHSSSPIICKDKGQYLDPPENRQHKAVAYINHLGGTASRELVTLTRDLWMWCLERYIHITAQHLPGVLNTIANAESRSCKGRTDWKLNPVIFQRINQTFGPLETGLFASRLTAQCPHYFSWRLDPYATATDAFLQTWTDLKGYANPPWNLIGRVLVQVQRQQVRIVLVAPIWRGQPWFPVLLGILIDYPPGGCHQDRTDIQSEPNSDHASSSRMAHLRKRYRDQQLSDDATALLLNS